MHIRTFALISFCLLGMISVPESALEAAVPQLINYQGRLTGPEGKPPATGDYTLSFSIYESPVGQSACTPAQMQFPTLYNCAKRAWGPQVFDGKSDMVGHGAKVPVVKGFFNVLLGPYDINGDPIARAFTASTASDRFVEVTVGDDAPVLPRQQVFSAPYALRSVGEVPVGGIIMWSGNESDLPDNWKICDGQPVTDPESPLHGQKLPNLQGLFVRGADRGEKPRIIEGDNHHDTQHTHWFSATVPVLMDKYSVHDLRSQGWIKRSASSYSKHDYVLLYDTRDGESHGHRGSGGVDGWTNSTGPTLDNRPKHMILHYIMRIK